MSAKANLLIYLNKNLISKSDFYKKTGLSNGFLDKNDNISSQNIEIIISNYPDLNVEWLLTGQGKMLKPIGLMNEVDAGKWENNPKVQHGEPLTSAVGQSDAYCSLFDRWTAALQTIEAQQETIAIQKERIAELKEQIKKRH